jgi:maltodextrin utilization protein YvdJ
MQLTACATRAAVRFTKEKEIAEDGKAKGHDVKGDLDIDFRKNDLSFLQNNETTISVSYTGGGQNLKQRERLGNVNESARRHS